MRETSHTLSYQFVESNIPQNPPMFLGAQSAEFINQVLDCLCQYTPETVNSHKVLAIKDLVNLDWTELDEDQDWTN